MVILSVILIARANEMHTKSNEIKIRQCCDWFCVRAFAQWTKTLIRDNGISETMYGLIRATCWAVALTLSFSHFFRNAPSICLCIWVYIFVNCEHGLKQNHNMKVIAAYPHFGRKLIWLIPQRRQTNKFRRTNIEMFIGMNWIPCTTTHLFICFFVCFLSKNHLLNGFVAKITSRSFSH